MIGQLQRTARRLLHDRNTPWLAAIMVATALLFYPSLDNPFLWDDATMLESSVAPADAANLGRVFTSHYLSLIDDRNVRTAYYRPVSLLVLLLERWHFGSNPMAYRLMHAGWHLLNAVLLFFVALSVLRRPSETNVDSDPDLRVRVVACGVSLLFLTLPYTADAVLLLTDLGDLMALAFMLLSAIAFERLVRSGRPANALLVLLLTTVALASKETALITTPLLLAAYLLLRAPGLDRRAVIGIAASAAAVTGYLVARSLVVGSVSFDPLAAVVRLPADLALAARWTLAPHPLALEEPAPGTIGDAWWWAGMTLCAILGSAVVLLRRRAPVIALAIVAWALVIAPSLLVVQGTNTFAPRYLYAPGAALALAIGALAAPGSRIRRVALAVLILAFALLAVVRIDAWDSAEKLWTLEAERHPDRPLALIHLGLAYEQQGRLAEALELQLAAIAAAERYPGKQRDLAQAHTNAARLLDSASSNTNAALQHLRSAVEVDPRLAAPWHLTGVIHARDGAYEKAEQAFSKALSANPNSADLLIALAGAIAAQGRSNEALGLLARARTLARANPSKVADIDRRIRLVSRLP